MRDKMIDITCFSIPVKSCKFIVYTYVLQKTSQSVHCL